MLALLCGAVFVLILRHVLGRNILCIIAIQLDRRQPSLFHLDDSSQQSVLMLKYIQKPASCRR